MAELYPKRVIWMQEEETLKWILVGLSADGEVQDPRDYEDVSSLLSLLYFARHIYNLILI